MVSIIGTRQWWWHVGQVPTEVPRTAVHSLIHGEHDVCTYVGRLLLVVLGSDLWVLDDVQVGSGHRQWCVSTVTQSNTAWCNLTAGLYLNQRKRHHL